MKILFVVSAAALAALPFFASSQAGQAGKGYPVTAVSYQDVQITDPFWVPRMRAVRTISVPYLLDLSQAKGANMDLAMTAKTVEAACYFLAQRPDPDLRGRVDTWLDRMVERLRAGEQLRRAGGGDLFHAAVGCYEAIGNRKLLEVAIDRANQLDSVFGPGKSHTIANHEGQLLGLMRLYRATHEEKYLKLVQFLLDERGNWKESGRVSYGEYAQDHLPAKAQTKAVGHCLRATYLYSSMTDLAAFTGDREYDQAADRIWRDAIAKRTYITGGVGSYANQENYAIDDFDLPNLACWNEICAACGNVFWNHRMFLLHQDAMYIDVLERVLYNALLAGVSLRGDLFLYQAPLKTYGSFARQPEYGPNCCPTNMVRTLAALGNLIYAYDDRGAYVNLFVGSKARLRLKQTAVTVEQRTGYPWEGSTKIVVHPERSARFAVFVRIPGWARNEVMPGLLYRFLEPAANFTLTVNGRAASYAMEKGFAKMEREWAAGDTIDLRFPMPVQKVLARDEVADDRGRVALERGPLVYCAEGMDNGGRAFNLVIPDNADIRFQYRRDLLGGIGTLTGRVLALGRGPDGASVARRPQEIVAIPYYAFGNRGTGEMEVWLARQESKAEIPPAPTIASTSRATSSVGNGSLFDNYPGHKLPIFADHVYPLSQNGSGDIRAIQDQIEPVNSEDLSSYYLRLRPQSGDQAWVQYDFAKPETVASVEVYWKDDKQYCPLPKAWRLLYQDGGQWKPVNHAGPYGVEKDKFNRVEFAPVATSALRMVITLQGKTYTKQPTPEAVRLGPPDANYMAEDVTWYEGGVIEWRVNRPAGI